MQNWQWAWQSTLNGALTTTQASAPLRHCWASYYWWAISCDMCVCVCVRACVCVLCVCVCVWVCVCVCVLVYVAWGHIRIALAQEHTQLTRAWRRTPSSMTNAQARPHKPHNTLHTVPCTRLFHAPGVFKHGSGEWHIRTNHTTHYTLFSASGIFNHGSREWHILTNHTTFHTLFRAPGVFEHGSREWQWSDKYDRHTITCSQTTQHITHYFTHQESSSMAVENDSGVTETVYPLRAHFLSSIDTRALLRLIHLNLPMRWIWNWHKKHQGTALLLIHLNLPMR